MIDGIRDPVSGTISYIVLDEESRRCALIDSVTSYDARSGRTSHALADRLIARVKELGATVEWILETHIHADHLSAAPHLREALGGRLAIGERISTVQRTFGELFNAGSDFHSDGRQFDHLFRDGEEFNIGGLKALAMHTPGHTPACMTFVVDIGDGELAAFVGDTVFMPDCGTARCDFPGGSARALYRSIKKLFALPPATWLFMCHDYPPAGRDFAYVCAVADQRAGNIHVRDGISEEEFVAMRTTRDAQLAMPDLIIPSVQVNIRGGRPPPPEANGVRYLKVPLNVL
jgi:glyoxylase-like metal-dependent hydrolase (beta-lactamase superfamily II)